MLTVKSGREIDLVCSSLAPGCRNRSNSLTQESHSRGSVAWSEKRQRYKKNLFSVLMFISITMFFSTLVFN